MATAGGGNVEGSKPDEEVVVDGVILLGDTYFEGRVPYDASQMYGNNLLNFVTHFWNEEKGGFELRRDDEIIEAALITHEGAVVHPLIKERMGV